MMTPDWFKRAACKNVTPEEADAAFFPVNGHVTPQARVICGNCTERVNCDAYARDTKVTSGIWAGVSHSQKARQVEKS